MHESMEQGRIGGIRVGANWSLLVVIWLIAWSLAGQQLPDAAPGHGSWAYWTAGALASVVFFGCLLAHELAHSFVARRAGVRVTGIVLWLFGGVSRFDGDPTDGRAELRIAAAGPAISVGLGLVFAALAVALDAATDLKLVVAAVGWLGWINLLLAGFNLLPAFPLDGGRVLRAWLWQRSGDKVSATVTAARVGRWFAYALIGLGLLQLVDGGLVGGVWSMFLGWFLLMAATAEATGSLLGERLGGLTVASVMTRDPIVVPDHTTVADLVEHWLYRHRCSTFPVVDGEGSVVGLVTMSRVKRLPPDQRTSTWVTQIACPRPEVVACDPADSLADVIARTNASPDQRALVFEGDRLVGIVSPSDISRVLERIELRTPSPV